MTVLRRVTVGSLSSTSTLRTVRRRVVFVALGSSRVSVTERRLTETLSSRVRVLVSARAPPQSVRADAPERDPSGPPCPWRDWAAAEPEDVSAAVLEPGEDWANAAVLISAAASPRAIFFMRPSSFARKDRTKNAHANCKFLREHLLRQL